VTPFACIVADCPWSFKDKLPGKSRGAAKNYRVEKLDRIKRLILPPIADDAYLFLWRVSSQVPEAYEVVKAWGFEHKAEFVWNKLTKHGKKAFGMGRTVRGSHESCIIAKRGRPKRLSGSIRSTFEAPVGEHSEKPDAFYALVEALCGGPRLEVFGRKARPGWTVIGDQAPGGKLLEVRP
jgi:N6-adenosine-specific RNA methylase IME4